MFSDKTYKFYIRDFNNPNLWWIVNSFGYVVQTNTPTEVGECIMEWQNIPIKFKRSFDWWGIFREFSDGAITFVNNGAKILKHIFNHYQYLGNAKLIVDKLNTTNLQYQLYYEGDITLENAVSTELSIEVNIKEAGLIGLLKNRQDVEYEIPLNDPQAITGRLNGVLLGSELTFILGHNSSYAKNNPEFSPSFMVGINGAYAAKYFCPQVTMTGNIQAGNFFIPAQQFNYPDYTTANITPYPSGDGIMVMPGDQDNPPFGRTTSEWNNVVIEGQLAVWCSVRDGYSPAFSTSLIAYLVVVDPQNTTNQTRYLLGQSAPFLSSSFASVNFNFGTNISIIPENRLLYLQLEIQNVNPLIAVNNYGHRFNIFTDPSQLNIRYSAKVPPSTYKAFRYKDLWQRLIEKITDNEYIGASSFFNNAASIGIAYRNNNFYNSPYNTVVTSGTSLRGLPNPSIRISLSQLLKDAFVQWNCGVYKWGAGLFLEPLSVILGNANLLTLTETNNFEVTPLSEFIFNVLKVGQRAYDNNNTVGRNEFNTTLTFLQTGNSTTEQKELDLVSPLRRDVYGIESIRVETLDEDKQDNRSDNDTFVIEINPFINNGAYDEYKPLGVINGVDDPSNIYNVTMSPKRAFYRNFGFIKSIGHIGHLRYVSIDKNSELETILYNPLNAHWKIEEIADVDLQDEGFPEQSLGLPRINIPKLFLPFVVSFDTITPYGLTELFSTINGLGYVTFSKGGKTFKGYVIEIGSNPATRESYRVSVLPHIDTNMADLL